MKIRRVSALTSQASYGLSLVEFMISLTLGLVVILASISSYLSALRASSFAEAQARMSDDAQAALSILSQQLRMAGNNPKRPYQFPVRNPVYDSSTFIIRGCDGGFSNLSTASNIAALRCNGFSSTSPDAIAISYEADRYNTVVANGSAPTDCLGQTLPMINANVTSVASGTPTVVSTNYFLADNRFYIGTSNVITAPSLYCLGNGGGTALPLVENIEDLQISYGTSPATSGSGTVAGYLTANGIVNDPDLEELSGDAARWSRVVSVRLCVLVRSENPVVSDIQSAKYTKCDGSLNLNPPDLRLRHAYITTVLLRNRL